METEQISLTVWEPSDQQILAACYRASGYTLARCAAKTGVSIRTMDRWAADEGFQAFVTEKRRELFESLEPKLAKLMEAAAEVLIEAIEGQIDGADPRVALAREISRDTSFRLLRARAAAAAGQPVSIVQERDDN